MAVTRFQDLPLADRERRWSGSAAEKRVRRWAGAEDEPNARYRRAFLWYDDEEPENFGSCRFPIADVVGGDLKAVPRAVMQAAAVLQGARGGTDLPKADQRRLKAHVARYYRKMDEKPPWED